ncbi:cytochrome c oxidase subunit CcoM [Spartinivicinus marinus]|nr:cytochrome c oxidase subunit CcoM [Spartinivicinus marinus]
MYIDETVLASLITIGLMIGFFVGVGLLIRKDINNHR